MAINEQQIKNDLYEAVNADWVKQAKIPADKPATGGFVELEDGVEKHLMADLDAFVAGKENDKRPQTNQFSEMLKLYQLAGNFKCRAKEGVQPAQEGFKRIQNLHSYQDYQDMWQDSILRGETSPVDFDIDADMKHATTYALFASAPSLILPDKTYYAKDNQQGPALLKIWQQMVVQLLQKFGLAEGEAKTIADQAVQFDALLVPHVKSAEESADYSKLYNPQTMDDFAGHTQQLDLKTIVEDLIGTTPDKIIVTEPAYFEALDGILANHFDLFKSWLLTKRVVADSHYLSEELRQLSGTYGRAISGRKESVNQHKFAYYLTGSMFSQVLGTYYGRQYFGPEAKKDVIQMVHRMVGVYEKRLRNNDWLSAATRQQAIKKLDNLGIQVGYPDKIPAIFDQLRVDPDQSLLANLNALSVTFSKDQFSRYGKQVDRMRWEMSASTVNAYYAPFKNIIVFPAAILQAPFYSLKQKSSENYGGIGAVMAHEISHAFDNNGSLFDEHGNLHNWWTKEDKEHFQKLAQKMIDEFNGLKFAGHPVNGKLTVSENIADGGGLSCALSAAKQEDDVDLRAFFINWGRIWRMKSTDQYKQLLLSIDVHAPNKLRANVQAQNQDDFYTTFDVHEGDGMYLAPDKRVNIW